MTRSGQCRIKTKEPSSVSQRQLGKRSGSGAACRRHALHRMLYPRRLVSVPTMRNRGQIWRIRFYQQTIIWYHAQDGVVGVTLECDDPTERQIPAVLECDLSQRRRSGKTVQHTKHAIPGCVDEHVPRIVFGGARVHHNRPVQFTGQRELRTKGGTLLFPGAEIVMEIKPALANGDSAECDSATDRIGVRRVPGFGFMRMQSAGERDQIRVLRRQRRRTQRGGGRLTNTHNGARTGFPGARHHIVHICTKLRVGEMHMAVGKRRSD